MTASAERYLEHVRGLHERAQALADREQIDYREAVKLEREHEWALTDPSHPDAADVLARIGRYYR